LVGEVLLGYFLIFGARVVDVSCATLRMLLLVRNKPLVAASIGFFEVIVYICALGYVVNNLHNDPVNIVFYALGFATGNIVGSKIEERMAIGYATVQVITLCRPLELAEELRQMDFGVTVIEGIGREGVHPILHIILPRKRVPELVNKVDCWDAKAFITVLETKATQGGFGVARHCRQGK